ncbi:FAD-dependent oxidoreductase [uncultured Pseudokineococcus sp.]|uniref:FAD-dependent oxidoreductase n=1 Tax=uncultured Pseudokineococcus sp. TaxID=1642928 RepID=UPI00260717FD|nr:FAD-dependent oxidoreductase [uncultured Pseudokineococcus sp.]
MSSDAAPATDPGPPGPARPPLRVAVVGSGPAGVHTAGSLVAAGLARGARVDVLERLPVPFGLVRYGVSPDHPEMKAVVSTLADVLDHPDVRLVANVEVGRDVTLDELRAAYDAVVLATGSSTDAPIELPGVDLPGCWGASELVAWYQGHPEAPRDWDLSAREVAVLGVGNVALDVARVLARPAEDLLATEVPAAVHAGLAASALTDVHVVGRRGPEHARFSPLELRELGSVPGVDVVVDRADLVLPPEAVEHLEHDRRARQVVEALASFAERAPTGAPRRVHLHFSRAPVEVLGQAEGRVTGLRTRRAHAGAAGVVEDLPVQAVYRAVGYRSRPVPGAPFDESRGVVPNDAGRVLSADGEPVPGLYVVGWLKTGPVGLVGSTRKDARATTASLLADLEHEPAGAVPPADPLDLVARLREGGLHVVDLDGWRSIDAAELRAGVDAGRPRVKLVSRDDLLAAARESRPR